jgi:hypothetical protein
VPTDVGAVTEDTLRIAQELADVATIAIMENQATKESGAMVGQLQWALNGRITTE